MRMRKQRLCALQRSAFLVGIEVARGDLNTKLVAKICNGGEFDLWDTFGFNRKRVLDDLVARTAEQGYNYYNASTGDAMAMQRVMEVSRMQIALRV